MPFPQLKRNASAGLSDRSRPRTETVAPAPRSSRHNPTIQRTVPQTPDCCQPPRCRTGGLRNGPKLPRNTDSHSTSRDPRTAGRQLRTANCQLLRVYRDESPLPRPRGWVVHPGPPVGRPTPTCQCRQLARRPGPECDERDTGTGPSGVPSDAPAVSDGRADPREGRAWLESPVRADPATSDPSASHSRSRPLGGKDHPSRRGSRRPARQPDQRDRRAPCRCSPAGPQR
jgi:hypothetical protein